MQHEPEKVDLCYLAAIDGGSAELHWPQTDPSTANRLQHSVYDHEISMLLKLNLLWRPFVTVRHLELFNNLAFAKFLKRHGDECRALSEAGLLRLCAPSVNSILRLTESWMLGRGPHFPMHWHHLDAERQKAYDDACLAGKVKTIEKVIPFLFLGEHHLDFKGLIDFYQEMFPESGLIQLGPTEPIGTSDYARRVQEKWEVYINDRKMRGLHMPKALNKIEKVLDMCHEQEGRRRTYYTELRYLRESLADSSSYERMMLDRTIAETKSFVLNDAYYDEFEGFTAGKAEGKPITLNITASRNISKIWLPDETEADKAKQNTEPEPLLSTSFVALDSLQLADVLMCHTSVHPEARAFQRSVEKLYRLGAMSNEKIKDVSGIVNAVRDHVQILRACLTRVLRDAKGRGLTPDVLNDSIAQVYLGLDPGIMSPVFRSGIGLAGMAYVANQIHTAVGLLVLPLMAVLVRRKTIRNEWKMFEAAFAKHIEATLTSEP